MRELVNLPRQEAPGYRCYTGHFFSLLEPLDGRPLPTVTILRDPVDLTLSLLRHCQRPVPGGGWTAPCAARGLPFAWQKIPACRTHLEKRFCPILMNNFQTRVLGSDVVAPAKLGADFYGLTYPFLEPSFCHREADLDALYARAVQRLESMVVVGAVERLPETVDRIFKFLGAPTPAAIPREHRARVHRQPSPDFLQLIESQNTYDRRLHRFAEQLLTHSSAQPSAVP